MRILAWQITRRRVGGSILRQRFELNIGFLTINAKLSTFIVSIAYVLNKLSNVFDNYNLSSKHQRQMHQSLRFHSQIAVFQHAFCLENLSLPLLYRPLVYALQVLLKSDLLLKALCSFLLVVENNFNLDIQLLKNLFL